MLYLHTVATDKPRDQHDFQNLLWQVAREHVSVFKDDNGWFLLIDGRYEHLRPDMFKLYFPDYDSLLAHCKKKFKDRGEEEQPAKKKSKSK